MSIFKNKSFSVSHVLTLCLGSFLFFSTFSIAGTQLSLTFAILFWAILAFFNKAPRPQRTSLDIPIILFLVAWIGTALFTDRRWDNLLGLKNLLLVSVVYLFGLLIRTRREGRGLVAVLLYSTAASSIYAISMFLLGRGKGTLGRTSGTFSTAMTLGGVMMLLCSLFFSLSVGRAIPRKTRVAAVLAAGLGCVALFFSFTRSSWTGMVVSAIVTLGVLRRKLLIPFAAALIVLFILLPGPYRHRVTSIWDPHYRTNVQRLELLHGGWNIFKDHPLVGVGSADLAEMYRRYKPPEAIYVHGHMHNIFVQVAVTTGIVGFIPFCLVLFSFFRLMVRNLRFNLPSPERAWVAGSIGAFAGLIVNGLFEWNFGDAEVVTLLYFIIGSNLAIAMHRKAFEAETGCACRSSGESFDDKEGHVVRLC